MSPPKVPHQSIPLVVTVSLLFLVILIIFGCVQLKLIMPGALQSYLRFIYGSFLKPHTGDSNGNQQEALESFYKDQAEAYDTTRTALLRGRDDMVEFVAAQLKHKKFARKPLWVDVSPFCPCKRSQLI
jgi:betaine lipid synthase